jgi:hypothetical protein
MDPLAVRRQRGSAHRRIDRTIVAEDYMFLSFFYIDATRFPHFIDAPFDALQSENFVKLIKEIYQVSASRIVHTVRTAPLPRYVANALRCRRRPTVRISRSWAAARAANRCSTSSCTCRPAGRASTCDTAASGTTRRDNFIQYAAAVRPPRLLIVVYTVRFSDVSADQKAFITFARHFAADFCVTDHAAGVRHEYARFAGYPSQWAAIDLNRPQDRLHAPDLAGED